MNFKKKKIMCLVIVLVISLLSLTSCSSNEGKDISPDETANVADSSESIAAEDLSEQLQEMTDSPTMTQTPSEEPTTVPTEEPTPSLTEEPTSTPTEEPTPTPIPTEVPITYGLEPKQLNAIGMLNYLAVMLQDIKTATGNRVYLQEMFTSLSGNTHPDVVDSRTQTEITDVLNTLSNLRMLAEKREHLSYIYDQKRAGEIFSALPNPLSILNLVNASKNTAISGSGGSSLMLIASLVYMAADSVSGYLTTHAQNELEHLDEGWDLEEKEKNGLDKSQIDAFNYLMDMKNEFNLKGDKVLLTLNEKAVQDYIDIKNTTNFDRRIQALLDNQKTYKAYGDYWLLLAASYYEKKDYQACLDAVGKFEELNVKLFRKDFDFAKVLPKAIVSADQVLSTEEYEQVAVRYLELICDNTYIDNWDLRYFVAITYLDLYGRTKNEDYLSLAYDITRASLNKQIEKQMELNKAYLADIKVSLVDTKNLSGQKKKDAENYNKMLEENRKKELPPIYEPLWLNCNLLYALADQMSISDEERVKLDGILHGNETVLFLNKTLDDYFWFAEKKKQKYDTTDIVYNKDTLEVPAVFVCDESSIVVRLVEYETDVSYDLDDWGLKKVERKDKDDIDSYRATYKSVKGAEYNYGTDKIAAYVLIRTRDIPDLPDIQATFFTHLDSVVGLVPYGVHFVRID